MDAIEAVIERHGLALVTQHADGVATLVGNVDREERLVWETVCQLGAAEAAEVADAAGTSAERAETALEDLWRRRLVIRQDRSYAALRGLDVLARADRNPPHREAS
jgi:hypothetical protein